MAEENISTEFKLKNIVEARNYFVEEIEQNELISKKHKMVCTTLYMLNIFLFYFLHSGCTSISVFDSLFDNPVAITSSAMGLKIYAITARIKKYKLIIKENK